MIYKYNYRIFYGKSIHKDKSFIRYFFLHIFGLMHFICLCMDSFETALRHRLHFSPV